MALYTLENDWLSVQVNDYGAELYSVKTRHGEPLEYLWQADPEKWARHAPILFPIVGRLKDDTYTYDGQQFSLSQHGFARDMTFECLAMQKDSIHFCLRDNEETRARYPFAFALYVLYRLDGKRIIVQYTVHNSDTKTLYFAIGAHPGFSTALRPGDAFSDYEVTVTSQQHPAERLQLTGPALDRNLTNLVEMPQRFALDHELFTNDAIIYGTANKETSVEIVSKQHGHGVRMHFVGFPYVGIWSPYGKDAPFVCIEPWCGIADTVQTSGKLEEKYGIQQLAPDTNFIRSYEITFL